MLNLSNALLRNNEIYRHVEIVLQYLQFLTFTISPTQYIFQKMLKVKLQVNMI